MNSDSKQTELSEMSEMSEDELSSVCGGEEKEYRPIYYFYYPYGGSRTYADASV